MFRRNESFVEEHPHLSELQSCEIELTELMRTQVPSQIRGGLPHPDVMFEQLPQQDQERGYRESLETPDQRRFVLSWLDGQKGN